jgi:alanine dehydrogenase
MHVGTVRERKDGEARVGLTPEAAATLVSHGHNVLVETGAGRGSSFSDTAYERAGAKISATAQGVWATCDLVVKVKEPIESEYGFLREGCAVFGYLHLAAEPTLTEHLLAARVTSIGPELIQLANGLLPCLAPMSQIAGRMAAEVGAHLLKQPGPGRGKLLGGIGGVAPGRAVVIGSGNVGTAATRVLLGLDARVTMISDDLPRLRQVIDQFDGEVATRVSTAGAIAEELEGADLAILSVLVPGGRTPHVVTRAMVRSMGEGAVLVDVSIDQGGAAETSRPTSHSDPIYIEEGVVHYCVTNMPGAVPHTSTSAYVASAMPYILSLADNGIEGALRRDSALARALNTHAGGVTNPAVAAALGLDAAPNPFL